MPYIGAGEVQVSFNQDFCLVDAEQSDSSSFQPASTQEAILIHQTSCIHIAHASSTLGSLNLLQTLPFMLVLLTGMVPH